MVLGVNCVIHDSSSARRTPGVSQYRSVTLEGNIIVVNKDRVMEGNLKRQIKNRTLCAWTLFLLN